jgi:hypothetical protein
MNLPLQHSEIGETWIQPNLFLVPDLPKEEENSDRPVKIGDEIYYYNPLESMEGWYKDVVVDIRENHIKTPYRHIKNGDWFLSLPESCYLVHCSSCNSFDRSIPESSPWKFCLLKGKCIPEKELAICDDFVPIIPYKAPAKTRRSRGDGSGSIVKRFLSKKAKKETKSYEQYWYDYELWENGVCLRKGSAYIPKNKLEEIELMNKDKEPVKSILERLGKII